MTCLLVPAELENFSLNASLCSYFDLLQTYTCFRLHLNQIKFTVIPLISKCHPFICTRGISYSGEGKTDFKELVTTLPRIFIMESFTPRNFQVCRAAHDSASQRTGVKEHSWMVIKVTEELSWDSPPPGNTVATLDFIMTRADDKLHDCCRKFNSSRGRFLLNTEAINPVVPATSRTKLTQTEPLWAERCSCFGSNKWLCAEPCEGWNPFRICNKFLQRACAGPATGCLCEAQLYAFWHGGGRMKWGESLCYGGQSSFLMAASN